MIEQTLKIGGHRIKLSLKDFEGDERCGDASYLKGEIRINKDLVQTQKEETLIHEVLHVCNTELDHVVLDSIAAQLYAFLKDNHLLNEERLQSLLNENSVLGRAAGAGMVKDAEVVGRGKEE